MGSDKVIVLCEDRAQEKLIRAWLQELGYNSKREVRFEPHAEAHLGKTRHRVWVEQMFPTLVIQHRSRITRMTCSLVACLDADDDTIVEVVRSMDKALSDGGYPLRSQTEHIAILIPKRHIETWLAFLDGVKVNEEDDYKNAVKSVDVSEASKKFALMATRKSPRLTGEPPSLVHVFDDECVRIPKR